MFEEAFSHFLALSCHVYLSRTIKQKDVWDDVHLIPVCVPVGFIFLVSFYSKMQKTLDCLRKRCGLLFTTRLPDTSTASETKALLQPFLKIKRTTIHHRLYWLSCAVLSGSPQNQWCYMLRDVYRIKVNSAGCWEKDRRAEPESISYCYSRSELLYLVPTPLSVIEDELDVSHQF